MLDGRVGWLVMAIFHYADFPRNFSGQGSIGEVGVMEFGLSALVGLRLAARVLSQA